MNYVIDYYDIPYGAHLFAVPEYTRTEHIKCNSIKELEDYILKQTDSYGNSFRKSENHFMGYDYISNSGGIKFSEYEKPKFKKPKFKSIN